MTIKDKVKELINIGYDDDIIMMSLEIPQSYLNLVKLQIEENNNISVSNVKTKLQLLRERYYNLANAEISLGKKNTTSLTQEQLLEIQKRLEEAETKMLDLKNSPQDGQLAIIKSVVRLLSYVDELSLPVDIAERVYQVFPKKENLFCTRSKEYIRKLEKKRMLYQSKYLRAMEDAIDNENDIEVLKQLLGKSNQFLSSAYIVTSSIQRKINQKISQIRMRKNIFQIPTEGVIRIAELIVGESYDETKVNELIEKETQNYFEMRKRVAQGKSNSQSAEMPTIELSRIQIFYQIGNIVRKQNYFLSNPYKIYERLININGNNSASLRIVLDNLISNGRFDEASLLIDNVFRATNDPKERKIKRQYKGEIRNAQIADFIMKGINAPSGSIEDENAYYEMIQKGIEKSSISPKSIVLGKTKEGRTITWNDLISRTKGIDR